MSFSLHDMQLQTFEQLHEHAILCAESSNQLLAYINKHGFADRALLEGTAPEQSCKVPRTYMTAEVLLGTQSSFGPKKPGVRVEVCLTECTAGVI